MEMEKEKINPAWIDKLLNLVQKETKSKTEAQNEKTKKTESSLSSPVIEC